MIKERQDIILKKMKAVIIENKKLKLKEVSNPKIGENDVLVKVFYSAVNRADVMQREGDYPSPAGCPEWLGLEVSGEIVEVGTGEKARRKWRVGDKVCCLLGGGGYAEFVSVNCDMCMPVPENCSMVEASCLPEALATAYLKLFIEAKAQKGETLLVTAGASGLASVVIPLAKSFGLRVITTVRSDPSKIKNLGADVVVDTRVTDLVDVLKVEYEEKRGVDIAIDCLGGDKLDEYFQYVNYNCRWIIIASLAGDYAKINLKNVFKKNIRIIGSTLRSRSIEQKAFILSELVDKVWDKVSAREIVPTIYKVLPITSVKEAHASLLESHVGKIVLKVN